VTAVKEIEAAIPGLSCREIAAGITRLANRNNRGGRAANGAANVLEGF
jgi:hypothetical protein